MVMKTNQLNLLKDKSGTVLLFALLIIAGVTATALVMGFLITKELQQAKNIDNSIVAYYTAESGIEDALYQVRKTGLTQSQIDSGVLDGSQSLSNNSLWERTVKWPEVINGFIKQNQFLALDLYEPSQTSSGADIGSLLIGWTDGNSGNSVEPWLEITLLEWQPSISGVDWGTAQKHITNKVMFATSESPQYINLTANKCYRIKLKSLYDDIAGLVVRAYSGENGTGAVRRFIGSFVVNSTGRFGSSRQAIKVNVLHQAPLSGIFDYIIFSEESLIKE